MHGTFVLLMRAILREASVIGMSEEGAIRL